MNDTIVKEYLNGTISVSISTDAPKQQQITPHNPKSGARPPTEGLKKNLLATCLFYNPSSNLKVEGAMSWKSEQFFGKLSGLLSSPLSLNKDLQ